MKSFNLISLIFLFIALSMSGCATLTESECVQGDWFRIGYLDGEAGHERRATTEHAKACADYGVRPNQDEYAKGYASGLEYYCTLAGGLKAGRRGQLYKGICPSKSLVEFQQGHRLGYEIYLVKRELDEYRGHLYHLQFEHANGCSKFAGRNNNRLNCGPSYYNSRYGSERVHLHGLELRLLNLERQASDLLLHDMSRPDLRYR